MRWWLALVFLCLLTNDVAAQLTSDTLEAAEVRARREMDMKERFVQGTSVTSIDKNILKIYRQESLADLLLANSTAFVKSTGLATFATLSLRGASAAQSAVYWEGIPLMNGATGTADISTLPVSMLQSVSVDYGASAALWGSGNVGGAVMLHDDQPAFNVAHATNGEARLRIGSFGQLSTSGRLSVQRHRVFISVNGEAVGAENDFPIKDERGQSFITQNARQRSYNAAATLGWRPASRDMLTARYWQYGYTRQIPRALFEARSVKEQADAGFRAMLHWQHADKALRFNSYVKAALFGAYFSYADSSIGLTSALRSRQAFVEGGWNRKVYKSGSLMLFAPLQYLWLPDVAGQPSQTRAAIAGAFAMSALREKYSPYNYRLHPSISFRLESFDGKLIPLPGANVAFDLRRDFSLRANAQYTYRAPTLNELHFNPGGNQDLKPERGWSFDGGWEWRKELRCNAVNLQFRQSASVYTRYIRDWIIWLGGAIWTPHNLAAVHSRGLELDNALSGHKGPLQWRIGLDAAYTRSTVTESTLPGDNSIGRQIPYVPLSTLTGTVMLSRKDLSVFWNTMLAGHRYVTSDESEQLPAYSVSNLRVSYDWRLRKSTFFTQLSVNNIFNTQYAVVVYRPMPGISWALSIGLRLTKGAE